MSTTVQRSSRANAERNWRPDRAAKRSRNRPRPNAGEGRRACPAVASLRRRKRSERGERGRTSSSPRKKPPLPGLATARLGPPPRGGDGKPAFRLHGLVVAAYTPFDDKGALNLRVVETQAAHYLRNGLRTVFIGGSTGESHSLSTDERRTLCQRWMDVARGTDLRVVVHVGSNCLTDAAMLARQAQDLGAAAVATLAPSYFKPRSVEALVECCQTVASGAPELPFYFYDIPVLTGVHFSMPEFLEVAAERIPNLAGIKFTNADLMAYQLCLHFRDGAYDVPWGIDEALLGALAVGARGAVGSSYNFAAPLYLKLLAAFERGDWDAAREQQFRSVRMIQTLAKFGYMPASKALLTMQGLNVGPARLPHGRLTDEQVRTLGREMESQGIL